jgi:hypothetical protein
MGFLKKIKNSIYSPVFYSNILQEKFSSAIGYFLLLALFLTALQSIFPIWSFFTAGQPEIQKFVDRAKNFYPSELEIKIQKGKVSINAQEPYFVPIPKDVDMKNETANAIDNFVVIDTENSYSASQFNEYKTFAWITEDSIITRDNNNSTRIYDLSKASDMTINRKTITTLINTFSPWLKFIPPLVIIGILLGVYMFYSARLIYLFFLALLIWLLTKIIKKPLAYWASYRVGLYAITLGLLVELLINWIGQSGFLFMTTIISLIIVFINLSPTKNAQVVPTVQSGQKEIPIDNKITGK